MHANSPYRSPPQIPAGQLTFAELEGKKRFWKRAAWCFLALFVIFSLASIGLFVNSSRRSFSDVGQQEIVDPQALSAAIGETLITAAAGLFLALTTFIFFGLFMVSLFRFRRYQARASSLHPRASA